SPTVLSMVSGRASMTRCSTAWSVSAYFRVRGVGVMLLTPCIEESSWIRFSRRKPLWQRRASRRETRAAPRPFLGGLAQSLESEKAAEKTMSKSDATNDLFARSQFKRLLSIRAVVGHEGQPTSIRDVPDPHECAFPSVAPPCKPQRLRLDDAAKRL